MNPIEQRKENGPRLGLGLGLGLDALDDSARADHLGTSAHSTYRVLGSYPSQWGVSLNLFTFTF